MYYGFTLTIRQLSRLATISETYFQDFCIKLKQKENLNTLNDNHLYGICLWALLNLFTLKRKITTPASTRGCNTETWVRRKATRLIPAAASTTEAPVPAHFTYINLTSGQASIDQKVKGCYQGIRAVLEVLGVLGWHWSRQSSSHRCRPSHLKQQRISVFSVAVHTQGDHLKFLFYYLLF